MKHREYPIALKQAAVASVAAGESAAEAVRDLKLRGRLLLADRLGPGHLARRTSASLSCAAIACVAIA
jgi:hypothetical protein